MGFAFSIKKIQPFMNEEPTNKAIATFCQSKFENHIPTKSFSLLSTGTFITTSKTEEEHFR